MGRAADDEEEIKGRDIGASAERAVGRQIPGAPIKSKVEEVSEDEDDESDEEDEDEITAMAAAQPAEPRNEVEPGTEFRKTAVHVYGLDFLRTGHMEEIFGQFNHKYIEWINDSSANVVFKDEGSAKKALESLSFPKTEDEPWRRTPDILVSEDVPPIFLQMRLATAQDKKRARKSVPKAMPFVHYTQNYWQSSYGGGGKGRNKGRKRMYADDVRPDKPAPAALAKSAAGPKVGTKRLKVTEEERIKRQRRAARFSSENAEAEQAEAAGDATETSVPVASNPAEPDTPELAPAAAKSAAKPPSSVDEAANADADPTPAAVDEQT